MKIFILPAYELYSGKKFRINLSVIGITSCRNIASGSSLPKEYL